MSDAIALHKRTLAMRALIDAYPQLAGQDPVEWATLDAMDFAICLQTLLAPERPKKQSVQLYKEPKPPVRLYPKPDDDTAVDEFLERVWREQANKQHRSMSARARPAARAAKKPAKREAHRYGLDDLLDA